MLGEADVDVSTVFFGGGTPTLLPAADLVGLLEGIDAQFGLAPDAEVTTEANPESVTPASLEALRAGGFTRISFGMQSVVPHVLDTLDRQHTRGRAARRSARRARPASSTSASTSSTARRGSPTTTGEPRWPPRPTLDVDHVSAYSLIVEPGTRLAARIARGELPMTDDDVLADRYEIAEQMLRRRARLVRGLELGPRPGQPGRHNLLYWTGGDWWGSLDLFRITVVPLPAERLGQRGLAVVDVADHADVDLGLVGHTHALGSSFLMRSSMGLEPCVEIFMLS